MRKTQILLIILILLNFCGSAQKAWFEFFTSADGLAGNNTSSVAQDDQGFLWLINDGKLHRYDGRTFLIYPPPPGLPAAQETLLGLAAYQDSLLFVWSEHFSFLFNPKTGDWQAVKLNTEKAAQNNFHFWLRFGHVEILINAAQKGFSETMIWRLNGQQLVPVRLPGHITQLSSANYWCDTDSSGYTYLCYQDTLYQLDNSGNPVAATPLHDGCTNCHDLCFQFGQNNTLVLLANWQFYLFDREHNRIVPHPANRFLHPGQNHLHRFILEKNGSIWACGEDRNLMYYDAAKDTLYNFHDELKKMLPNPNDFKGIFQDNTGIVWVNTRLGLLKVRPQTYPFDTYFTGLNALNAYYSFRGFTEDPQGIVYGVFYDGIAAFAPGKKQAQRIYTFKKILNFFDLYAVGNQIWVNSGQYLAPASGALIDVPSAFFEHYIGDNGFFTRDASGTLWWVSHYYLFRLQQVGNGFQWQKDLELPVKVYNKTDALHAGRQSGKLWISFNGKLLQYAPETRELHWFDPAEWGQPVSRITVIQEDQDRKLWLGTDAGLVRFDPLKGVEQRYTVSDGLPNNFICGLLTGEGDSCLWLSTNHGLSRFHIPSGTFINFFEEDGLSSNEFNRKSYFKTRDGRMVFGGMRGVNTFYPEALIGAYQNQGKGAQMTLTSFEYTDERRDTILRKTCFAAQPEIRLHHWDWSYTFEYVLTDYTNPKEVLYTYKMDGYKDSWSAPSKFNFARFNSLPAGEYVFRVKARDSHGHWHPDELAVRVVVYPPWWATWWAYTSYALLAVILLYFLRRYELNRQALKTNVKIGKLEAEKLKELNHFKSRLYTNLTHEFRTPLTVILGMAQQIRSEPLRYLDEGIRLIESNGKNLLRLINQLLDLSKLENKSFHIHLRQADIVPYLRYITESFQTYANSKNLSLRFMSTPESLVLDYDEEQIKQVLTNLISNALKFTPSGGEVIVRLTVFRPNLPGLRDLEGLEIAVRDSGIGIATKNLPYVFDRFYQVDDSHTREGEGSGIGLAHTQELVKIMGGTITVSSEVGKGSTFIVRLPITKTAPLSNPAISNQPISTAELQTSNSKLQTPDPEQHTILIIEDNPDVVIYLKSCLDSQYQLDVAHNGKIGIEKALENIPDLIISDVMMPEKDGYQVCDTLKNDERTSHIPIILLTAKADPASRITGLRRGADVYLFKPFDKEELLVRLEMLLERQKRMLAHFSKRLPGQSAAVSDEPALEEAIVVEDAFINKLQQIVAENYAQESFALPQLCEKIAMSRSQLFRKMQALLGVSPSNYIRSYRLNQAKILLETTDKNVSEVAWQVGFKDPGHFSRLFQDEFGFLPSAAGK